MASILSWMDLTVAEESMSKTMLLSTNILVMMTWHSRRAAQDDIGAIQASKSKNFVWGSLNQRVSNLIEPITYL